MKYITGYDLNLNWSLNTNPLNYILEKNGVLYLYNNPDSHTSFVRSFETLNSYKENKHVYSVMHSEKPGHNNDYPLPTNWNLMSSVPVPEFYKEENNIKCLLLD